MCQKDQHKSTKAKTAFKKMIKLNPGVNFYNIIPALLFVQILKVHERQSSCQSIWNFWDLGMQKLLVEHWWNWTQVNSSGIACDSGHNGVGGSRHHDDWATTTTIQEKSMTYTRHKCRKQVEWKKLEWV